MFVHISRQQGQSLLHVGQHLRLKAGADLLQRINPLIPANMPRWTSAAMTRTAARTASTTPHTRDFRNGGAVSKRSPEEVGIDN